jgi:hypothetical protein
MTGSAKGAGEMGKRQRVKNWAMLVVLAGLAILFYFVTVVKFGAGSQ